MRARNIVKFLIIAGVIALVLIYGFLKTRDLIFGTEIVIDTPHDGQTLTESLVTIKGHVDHVTKLEINGKLTLADENGNFVKNYALVPGLNRLTIIATDRFDRSIYKTLRLYYNAPAVTPLPKPIPANSTLSTGTNATSTNSTSTATSTPKSATTSSEKALRQLAD